MVDSNHITIIKGGLRSTRTISDTIDSFSFVKWLSVVADVKFLKCKFSKNGTIQISMVRLDLTVSSHVSPSNWIQSITNRCLVRDRRSRGPRQQGADLPHNPSLTSFFLSLTFVFTLSTLSPDSIWPKIQNTLLNILPFCI